MATIKIPCLVRKGAAFYWQPSKTLAAAGWKSLPLGRDEDDAIAAARERNRAVDAWRAGGEAPDSIAARHAANTLGALIARYRREHVTALTKRGIPILKPKSQAVYETSLKRLDAWAGSEPLAAITRQRVRDLRDDMLEEIGHAATHALLTRMRTLFRFAEQAELIEERANPAENFGLPAPPPRAEIWEAEDEAAFIASAHALGMPSLALACELAIYTAQRSGDLIGMTASQLKPVTINNAEHRALFTGADGRVLGWHNSQEKRLNLHSREQVLLEIPFTPELRARIEAALDQARARAAPAVPIDPPVLCDDRTGKAWDGRAFREAWRRVLDHAADASGRPGMRALVWHDLRRTRVVRLRRQSIDPARIAAITGHSLSAIAQMLRVYGPVDAQITAAAIAAAL